MIERQVGHMTRLIDDLMDVARIARGKILLQKERILADPGSALEAAGLDVARISRRARLQWKHGRRTRAKISTGRGPPATAGFRAEWTDTPWQRIFARTP
ncbi:MAG: hypothetical protein LC796_01145 [Acidobacteria bacterium]|nr:hypothetical protein [Acidobacteriota bacterium]